MVPEENLISETILMLYIIFLRKSARGNYFFPTTIILNAKSDLSRYHKAYSTG
jgi:hypothetical protein